MIDSKFFSKLNNVNISFLIICLFLLNETFRSILCNVLELQLKSVWLINFGFVITFFIFFMLSIQKKLQINKVILFIGFSLIFLILINNIFGYISIRTFIFFIFTYSIPFVFLTIKIDNENFKNLFIKFIKYFNIIILGLTVYGIVDYFLGRQLQFFIAKYVYERLKDLIYIESTSVYRMYSPLGHPLNNAKYYLIFYIFNNVYNKYFNGKVNNIFILTVTIIGLFLSGSKTALIIEIFLIIFFNGINRKKFLYYIGVCIIFVIALNSTLFENNLMMRFKHGIQRNDLSSGRNLLLEEVIKGNYPKPNFIISGGEGYSVKISKLVMVGAPNFEYPPIMFAYDYGIFETILIYLIIFMYPIIIFAKNKDYFMLVNFLCLFLYVNCYNGLFYFSDNMAVICFLIMILINISENNKLIKFKN